MPHSLRILHTHEPSKKKNRIYTSAFSLPESHCRRRGWKKTHRANKFHTSVLRLHSCEKGRLDWEILREKPWCVRGFSRFSTVFRSDVPSWSNFFFICEKNIVVFFTPGDEFSRELNFFIRKRELKLPVEYISLKPALLKMKILECIDLEYFQIQI